MRAYANDMIGEVSHLAQATSGASRAAAEVVVELHQKLANSMVRGTTMLDERACLLDTPETLLDAVSRVSTEWRVAVDVLVTTSTDLLERVGDQFTGQVETEIDKLDAVTARVTGSAVEVVGLGEASGVVV